AWAGDPMHDLAPLTAKLRDAEALTDPETELAAAALAAAEVPDADKEAFLIALTDKDETAAEIAGFARAFRQRAIDPGVSAHAPEAIDIVGTGGDHSGG